MIMIIVGSMDTQAQTNLTAQPTAPINALKPKALSTEAKIVKQRCEGAAKRILATQPTTWQGDMVREIVAYFIKNTYDTFQSLKTMKQRAAMQQIIQHLVPREDVAVEVPNVGAVNVRELLLDLIMANMLDEVNLVLAHPAVGATATVIPANLALAGQNYQVHINKKTPFYLFFVSPIFRLLIDKFIRKTGDIDKDLDLLISQKELSLEGMLAADFEINDLEAKILTLSDKCEWFRWIYRALEIWEVMIKPYKNCPSDNEIIKIMTLVAAAALCWYVYVMQSATWKKSERLAKIQILKELLINKKKKLKKKKTAPKKVLAPAVAA